MSNIFGAKRYHQLGYQNLKNYSRTLDVLRKLDHWCQSKRHYCDIKTNVGLLFSSSDATTIIPSVLKIKRTIKNRGIHELDDGFACIRTKCPVCTDPTDRQNVSDPLSHNKIFVNKTTGLYIQSVYLILD